MNAEAAIPVAPIGIAGVSAEGALLCAKIIQSRVEGLEPGRRPQVLLHMHPFAEYIGAMSRGALGRVADLLADSVERLRLAGAALAIIPANAPHLVFDDIARRGRIPLLNLVELAAGEGGKASGNCSAGGSRRAVDDALRPL